MVIIGGGFGGLYAANALRRAPVRVTLVDRRNHHVFQPLLYQVATASLSPADIAAPIRHILSRQRNATVLLGEVVDIDTDARLVHLANGRIGYDHLIVATGATHSYFGNEDWSPLAPGLKSVEDALEIRRRFLLAFEAAELEADPDARRARLTFLVVGGGPTGVELAGAMIEIARKAIPCDFRSIDTATARIILVEAHDRILRAFPPDLSARARQDLEKLGVQVRTGSRVTQIDQDGVRIGDERIDTRNVIWAAGVRASPLGNSLGAEMDPAGCVVVEPDLSIKGHPNVFVIGDLAHVTDDCTGQKVPGVAPAAIQEARYVARLIKRETRSGSGATARKPFCYANKGMLATIGRAKAVVKTKRLQFAGPLAWLFWAMVHVCFLIGFRSRLLVVIQWGWAWFTYERGARLITGDSNVALATCSIPSASTSETDASPLPLPPLPATTPTPTRGQADPPAPGVSAKAG